MLILNLWSTDQSDFPSIRHVRESDHVRENSHYINSNLRFYEIKSVNVLISFRHQLPLNRDPQARISSGRRAALESLLPKSHIFLIISATLKLIFLRLGTRLQQNTKTKSTCFSWLLTMFKLTYNNYLSVQIAGGRKIML